MASFNKFNQFVEDLAHGVHNFSADTIRVALSDTAPGASDATLANITEITAQNGYSAGGPQTAISNSGQLSGTYTLDLTDVTITASGGTIGPFRYVIVYNDSQTSPADPLIGWYDYGSSITLNDGEQFTVDFEPTLLTLS